MLLIRTMQVSKNLNKRGKNNNKIKKEKKRIQFLYHPKKIILHKKHQFSK